MKQRRHGERRTREAKIKRGMAGVYMKRREETKEPAPLPGMFQEQEEKKSTEKKGIRLHAAITPKKNKKLMALSLEAKIAKQKRILRMRLKVPPAVNHFGQVLDANTTQKAFQLFKKYRPETRTEKKERLKAAAERAAKEGKLERGPKPLFVKSGLRHVTDLIENKKAALVLIANDVEPLELVVWLPALCRKVGVPYAIVKGKRELGRAVNMKTATAVCLQEVRRQDSGEFRGLLDAVRVNYAEKYEEARKQWGGGLKGKIPRKLKEKL
ncbi:MAG: 60S ribosomal protein L7A [Amphiamblys sp. WSBS2006]|nr:MAG: 60S ribosomal protein L7A [Amphiamblys sp. WSBS2006]